MSRWLEEMRALTEAEVLFVCEKTMGQKALRQVLECLACATPEHTAEDWASLPFGQVCVALYHLRSLMFGSDMPGVVTCPQCGDRLEFTFEYRSFEVPEAGPALVRIECDGSAHEIRLPTVGDLLASNSAADLLLRCSRGPIEPSGLWIEAASDGVAQADPFIETTLDIVCPACENCWQALFDIVAYFSREIAHHARRLLGEVHGLASAYGWSEREILALPALRRRAYLEMAEA